MTIEELNIIDKKYFIDRFGGTFFMYIFNNAVHESKKGCFILKDIYTTEKLIKESLKNNINLLEIELQKTNYCGII